MQSFYLEIADKEFVVLVGPSDVVNRTRCGWLGLEEISVGELYINERRSLTLHPRIAILQWYFRITRCIRI